VARLDAPALQRALRERDVLALAVDQYSMRLVTHLDVNRAQIEEAAQAICDILSGA
jgi:threonine aldolase